MRKDLVLVTWIKQFLERVDVRLTWFGYIYLDISKQLKYTHMKNKSVRLKAIEKIIRSRKKDGYYIQIIKMNSTMEFVGGRFDNVDEEFIDKMIIKYNS